MNLPEKFQFRVKGHPGYSHTAKQSPLGYKIKWARGWDRYLFDNHPDPELENAPAVPSLERHYVADLVGDGTWIIVDDTPKQKNVLPDVVQFKANYFDWEVFRLEKQSSGLYRCTCVNDPEDEQHYDYSIGQVEEMFSKGVWRILDKKPLSAEQQKAIKQMKEQVAALESSIKLNEQSIEHYRRLVGNYTERMQELVRKIAELEG